MKLVNEDGTICDPQPVPPLGHTMSCDALTPGEYCTCCLKERQNTQTAEAMYAAWRKRAEEAEIERDRLAECLSGAVWMSNDEDRRDPHDIGKIAYKAAAAATGCEQPWDQATHATKWNAAARAVLAWACRQMELEAEYGCPCNEDERLTWDNANLLRELGGLPTRPDSETPNV